MVRKLSLAGAAVIVGCALAIYCVGKVEDNSRPFQVGGRKVTCLSRHKSKQQLRNLQGGQFGSSLRNAPFSGQSVIHSMYPHLNYYDVLQTVGDIPPGSIIKQVNGVAGYVRGRANGKSGTTSDAVAIFGVATAEAPYSAAWGINTAVSDSTERKPRVAIGRFITGTENDLYAQNSETGVEGYLAAANSLAQPKFGAGYVVGTLSRPVYYTATIKVGSTKI